MTGVAPEPNNDIYINHASKIDEQGNVLWTKYYTRLISGGLRVKELANSNLMFSGPYIDSLNTVWGAIIILCDANGDTLWSRIYPGLQGTSPGPNPTYWDGNYTSDGGFIISGQTHCCNFTPNVGWTSSLWVLKTDSLGLVTGFNNEAMVHTGALLGEPYPNPAINLVRISTLIPP